MPNETIPAANGETPNATDPQTETVTTSETGKTPGTTSTDDAQKEIESLKAALKKANAESASHRHKAKELDDLKAQVEAEKLSEKEKLEKKLADVQKAHDDAVRQAQEYKINSEVRIQAAQLGFADPNDAIRLLDLSQIDYDESGTPTNVHALLKDLLKTKAYLAGKAGAAQQTSGGATNPSRSQTQSVGEITDAYIANLTPQAFNALSSDMKARVSQYMQERVMRRR